MYELYPYQQLIVDSVENGILDGDKNQIVYSPTGAGKTIMAGHMILKNRERNPVFVVEKIELARQAVTRFEALGLKCGILRGEDTCISLDDDVLVASAQTMRRRGIIPSSRFILIDEIHLWHGVYEKIMQHNPDSPVIGLSATPMRENLGLHFSRLVRGTNMRELMEEGYLVGSIRAFAPQAEAMRDLLSSIATGPSQYGGRDFQPGALSRKLNTKALIGDLVTEWKKHASDRQTICFASSVPHSRSIAEQFREAGVRAEHIDAHTDSGPRREIIDTFRQGDIQLLTSVGVLTTGFDAPAASCAIMARPTLSLSLYIQMVGRVMRSHEGKTDTLILDHAGNTLRHGPAEDFIPPDLGETDTTTGRQLKKQRKAIVCQGCDAVIHPGVMTCPECGLDRPHRSSKVTLIDGVLVEKGDVPPEVSKDEQKSWYLALLWKARHSTTRNGQPYKDSWAAHAWREKFKTEEWPPWEWQQDGPQAPNDEQLRWLEYYRIRKLKGFQKRGAALKKARRLVKASRPCPACSSTNVIIVEGRGPHIAARICARCSRHMGWVGKQEFNQLEKRRVNQ